MSKTTVDIDHVRNAVRELEATALDRLAAVVREDSQLGNEAPAQELMAGWYAHAGLEVKRVPVDPDALRDRPGFSPPVIDSYEGRDNIVGTHQPRTDSPGRSLILNGHIDVVPPGPAHMWTTPPFEPDIRDGRMYGRGAGDMKAGNIAALTALEALHALGYQPAAPLHLQSVIEEECTGNGALACLEAGYTADAAIVPEPFHQTLTVAQVGVMWAQLAVTGRPSHVLDTSAGISAIDAAVRVCEHLREMVERWNDPQHRHPAWADHPHPLNFNLGRLDGGDWASTVPPYATAHIRLGFFPGMELEAVRGAIRDTVDRALADDPALAGTSVEITWRGHQTEPCIMDPQAPMMRQLADAHHRVTGNQIETLAATATTDARFFQLYGNTPATCYGPDADRIHGIDESVSIKSMMEVAAVLALFIADWCGLEQRSGN